jgi:hypothetical protein
VVDYHGLGHRHLTTHGFLVRPQLNAGTLARAGNTRLEASWSGREWTAQVVLPAWHVVAASVQFLSDSPIPEAPPTPAQLQALDRLAVEQAELHSVTIGALRAHYDRVRPKYVAFARQNLDFMGDPDVSMPAFPDDRALSALHQLQVVYIHNVSRNSLAYVGLLFSATWEPEHGVGVLVHGTRVVEVGGADTAFLEWMAEKDRDAKRPG